ncbi:hypothetical protein [Paenibacillus sp. LjRoot56]|uniref:hypothetical protein n=1 Tax=Paenibacillus sp. LjRoot56 TaxID=3342333 RepID=UPI003F4FF261
MRKRLLRVGVPRCTARLVQATTVAATSLFGRRAPGLTGKPPSIFAAFAHFGQLDGEPPVNSPISGLTSEYSQINYRKYS